CIYHELYLFFFFSSRRRHTRCLSDWSSDVCSSDLESLWADQTVCTDANCTGPTGVRWYQFDVTGGAFPATAVQQQTWTNSNDGRSEERRVGKECRFGWVRHV